MIVLIVVILIAAVLTGSLGGVLEIAAGVAVGLFLFVVGLALAGYYFMRYRFRRARREWERSSGPPDRYGRR